jgi:hypothetical protein
VVTDLGEQPTPHIQPAEPPPGGVDAIDESLYDEPPLVPDLTQIGNEGSKDKLPDELTEPDQTDTAATRDGAEDHQEEPSA